MTPHASAAPTETLPRAVHAARVAPNDLALFAHIAEAGSFSRAAELLGQPRSTISRHLSELEELLGERLLLRSTRKLRLTEFGRAMLGHAEHVLDAVSAAQGLAENRRAEPSGRLRITMPAVLAQNVASAMIAKFLADYPKVTLELELSSRRVDLLDEDRDLVVTFGPLQEDAALTASLLCELPMSLYASQGYLDRMGAPSRPEDLEQHDGLLIARHGGAQLWELLGPHSPEQWTGAARPRCLATSGEMLLLLARAGHGIAGLPDILVTPDSGLVHTLPDWRLPRLQVWAVFPGRLLLPTKTRAFLEALRRLFS
jgi:DNA-binding transcriptional LysR family regulator